MKTWMVLLLAGCFVVLSPGFSKGAADDDSAEGFAGGQIPLRKLAGIYAATVQGPLVLCFANTPPDFPPAECGSTGALAQSFSVLQVGATTRDAAGHACTTSTITYTHLPVDTAPPFVQVTHGVGRLTSYDPTTATGDSNFTTYAGGQCHGATFDSTGATVLSTGTTHFAASDHGKRVDGVVTSLTNAVGSIGGFSLSVTNLRH